jgi:hypothetical protein
MAYNGLAFQGVVMNINTGSVRLIIIWSVCICFLNGCQDKEQAENGDIFNEKSDITAKVDKGWHQLEQSSSGQRYRWTGQEADLVIEPSENTKAQIKIYLSSFSKARNCNVLFGDKTLISKSVSEARLEVLDFQANLVKGKNVLRITSPEKSQSPAEIPEMKSQDNRSLSFVVSSISIKKIG